MAKLGIANYDRVLSGILTIPQQMGGIAGELSPEISPVFVLEAMAPEWCYLQGKKCMAAAPSAGASVGNPSVVRFRNPATSMGLAVFELGVYTTTAAASTASVRVGTATTDRAGAVTPGIRDSRFGTSRGFIVVSQDNAAIVGTEIESFAVIANTPYVIQMFPLVLAPGSHVDIGSNTNNVTIIVSARWSERELRQYEQ